MSHSSRPSLLFTWSLLSVLGWMAMGFALAPAKAADAPAKLVINKAVYGDLPDGAIVDVTEKVAAIVKDNSLSVAATSEQFGDPAKNTMKKLKVSYTFDGIYRNKTVNEGETLDISTRLVIRKAVYGDLKGGKVDDVTEQVADLVRNNELKVKADNETFGDPANGVVKQLKVDYILDGKQMTKIINEGSRLVITIFKG